MTTSYHNNSKGPVEADPDETRSDNWNLMALEVCKVNMEWQEMASLLLRADTMESLS